MNLNQIDRLVASVPATVEAPQRARIEGYGVAARRCELRITGLRTELDEAMRAVREAAQSGANADAAADRALDIARELDSLERLQPRIDAWLRVAVGAISDEPLAAPPFGEGPV